MIEDIEVELDGGSFIESEVACDYFRSGLIECGYSPSHAEDFLRYMHSKKFRKQFTDDDLCNTPFEAMVFVDHEISS